LTPDFVGMVRALGGVLLTVFRLPAAGWTWAATVRAAPPLLKPRGM
jgi:hypothetical protein